MRRHRKTGHPVQPHWEQLESTQETSFCWLHWRTLTEFLKGRKHG